MPQFKYDGLVLDPDFAVLPGKINGKEITLKELPKSKFDSMLKDLFDVEKTRKVKVTVTKNAGTDEETEVEEEQEEFIPLLELAGGLREKAYEYFGYASGEKPEFWSKYFEEAPGSAFTKILGILYEVNHVHEVLSLGGNVSMLPMVTDLLHPTPSEESSSASST